MKPELLTNDTCQEGTATTQAGTAQEHSAPTLDDHEGPPNDTERLIKQWFSEGSYISMLINEMTTEKGDHDHAAERLDLLCVQTPDELFSDWTPEFDERGLVLRVPHRPLLGHVVMFCFVVSSGWFGWFWIQGDEQDLVKSDAMAGQQHELDHEHAHDSRQLAQPPVQLSEEANFSGDAISLGIPKPGDWLHTFPEQGQTYRRFLAQNQNKRSPERFVLYLQPLGQLTSQETRVFNVVTEYINAYFDIPVRVLPSKPLPSASFESRREQYDAQQLLPDLGRALPKDAVGLLAVTSADLFIPSLNFVFGLGSTEHRVAVFSTYRHGTDFRIAGMKGTVLRRSMTVAVHELGHIVTMRHCTEFHCIMNGNSSLEEADNHPLHMCPVCIRKAEFGFDFDRKHRYQRVLNFYERYGFGEDAGFVRRRLAHQYESQAKISSDALR